MSGKSIVVESQPFAKDVDSLVGFFVPSTQQEGSREVSLCRSSAVNKDDFFCRDVLSLSGPDEARILMILRKTGRYRRVATRRVLRLFMG